VSASTEHIKDSAQDRGVSNGRRAKRMHGDGEQGARRAAASAKAASRTCSNRRRFLRLATAGQGGLNPGHRARNRSVVREGATPHVKPIGMTTTQLQKAVWRTSRRWSRREAPGATWFCRTVFGLSRWCSEVRRTASTARKQRDQAVPRSSRGGAAKRAGSRDCGRRALTHQDREAAMSSCQPSSGVVGAGPWASRGSRSR